MSPVWNQPPALDRLGRAHGIVVVALEHPEAAGDDLAHLAGGQVVPAVGIDDADLDPRERRAAARRPLLGRLRRIVLGDDPTELGAAVRRDLNHVRERCLERALHVGRRHLVDEPHG